VETRQRKLPPMVAKQIGPWIRIQLIRGLLYMATRLLVPIADHLV